MPCLVSSYQRYLNPLHLIVITIGAWSLNLWLGPCSLCLLVLAKIFVSCLSLIMQVIAMSIDSFMHVPVHSFQVFKSGSSHKLHSKLHFSLQTSKFRYMKEKYKIKQKSNYWPKVDFWSSVGFWLNSWSKFNLTQSLLFFCNSICAIGFFKLSKFSSWFIPSILLNVQYQSCFAKILIMSCQVIWYINPAKKNSILSISHTLHANQLSKSNIHKPNQNTQFTFSNQLVTRSIHHIHLTHLSLVFFISLTITNTTSNSLSIHCQAKWLNIIKPFIGSSEVTSSSSRC